MKRLLLAAGIALGLSALAPVWAADIPTTPEDGPVRMATNPWLGYGPWYIAQEKGLFKKNGLNEVTITNFDSGKEMMAAISSGQVDAANFATNNILQLMQVANDAAVVVLLEDFSLTADAILSKDISNIKGIKGKQVAFAEGETSDVLLNYALAQNGMTIDDITRVPMPAAQAGTALIAGQVPVAVTYEPYIGSALAQDKDAKIIYSAGEDPGLISDVLVVSKEMLEKRPGQVLALINSWRDSVNYYQTNTQDGRAIIAKAVGAPLEDLKTAFDGVRFYSLADNKKYLSGEFQTKVVPDIQKAMIAAKMLDGPVDTKAMIDTRFVEAAKD